MKEKIMACAAGLFNEKGVNQTSFRNIAQQLELSDGHVRYYFKTKETLLLAIFNKMNDEILVLSNESAIGNVDVVLLLKKQMTAAFSVMVNYSFLFVESPKTIKQFPKLAEVYKHLVKDRKALFLYVFQDLISKGFFKSSFTVEQQEQAFYSIFIISDSWIRYHTLSNDKKPSAKEVDFYANLAFGVLVPYLK